MLEEKEILAAVNVELNRVFKANYTLPKNPQNYNWQCLKCKKPLFYNQYENCFIFRNGCNNRLSSGYLIVDENLFRYSFNFRMTIFIFIHMKS